MEDPELALPFPFLAQDAQHDDLGMSSSEPFDTIPCPCNFSFWCDRYTPGLSQACILRRHLIRGSSASFESYAQPSCFCVAACQAKASLNKCS
jgi:hypothetical protein